jgi:glycosyltransferase involved in cell wall biosynthesis
MASGVPPVVTANGGPKFLVTHRVTGLVGSTPAAFLQCVVDLARDPALLQAMRVRAREFAMCRYWHRIFEQVYDAYRYCLRARNAPAIQQPSPAPGRTLA